MTTSVPQAGSYSAGPSGDAVAMMRYDAAKKSMGVAYLLWFFLGGFGGHRFYLGQTGSAVAMLVICIASIVLSLVFIGLLGFVVLGIWALVDAFLIPGMVRSFNNSLIDQIRR